MSDEVFLTGASGFVGRHVLDALLARGYGVRALVRSEVAPVQVDGCVAVMGDLREPGALMGAMRGCRYLVHVAAVYSFSPRERAAMYDVNVRGTRGLLEAARIAGVERAVVTSSSAAVGPARHGHAATEADWAHAGRRDGGYHASKVAQERVALAARLPVITVLPTAPIGAGDHRPTPTGQMVVDVMRGRMPATLRGGMNAVAVSDVAHAHVLALELGRPRERYIAGGVNLTLAELTRLIARAAGRSERVYRMPYALAAAAGYVDELRCRALGGAPRVPLEGVRMGREYMYASSDKARDELGYTTTAVETAIDSAVRWYRANGHAA